jgi:hypothetical protein
MNGVITKEVINHSIENTNKFESNLKINLFTRNLHKN